MKYIIREGTVRGQGRYLAAQARWSVDIQPALWWPEGMHLHAADVARERGGRVVRLTTKAERAVRKERAATLALIDRVACQHALAGALQQMGALVDLGKIIRRGDHRKGE